MLKHLVLAHHGRYEFGSPRLPAIPEAIAIHHLDNLDAKINQFLSAIDNDRDPDSPWTEYQRAPGNESLQARRHGHPRRVTSPRRAAIIKCYAIYPTNGRTHHGDARHDRR